MLRKTISIIDADEETTNKLSLMLDDSHEFRIESSYHDIEPALLNLQQDVADFLIIDLNFHSVPRLDFIPRIREQMPRTSILVFTDQADEHFIFQALGQGASGYLLKKNGIQALPDALRVLSNGGSPLDPWVARCIVRSIQINELSPLSPRESTVLKLLSQGNTYSAIALALDLSNETVKTHLKNIYKKLNVNSKAQAIQKAMEEQLVLGVYH